MSRLNPLLKLSALTFGLYLALSVSVQADIDVVADIEDAVNAVKNNPTNTSKVGSRWYGRSTSQSIHLPPMLNDEMGDEIIEGAIGATASGGTTANEVQLSSKETALGRNAIDDQSRERVGSNTAPTNAVNTDTYIQKKRFESTGTSFGSSVIYDVRGGTSQRSYHNP